jgi:hypothetical protein
MNPFCLGLDLGQAADFSALTVLEMSENRDPMLGGRKVRHYVGRALKRWPPHTP